MPAGNIGKMMNYGFAGTYARHPEMLIYTRPNDSEEYITFGAPVMRATTAQDNTALPTGYAAGTIGVKNVDATLTNDNFVGVAAREVKSVFNYLDQSIGQYAPHEPVSVFERGSISVLVPDGEPVLGGAVYIRTVADAGAPANGLVVGSWSANDVSGETVLMENLQWMGPKDSRNVAELGMLRRTNA